MRNILFPIMLLAAFHGVLQAQYSETLLFVDKSQSVSFTRDAAVNARSAALNKQLVTDRYRGYGDKVTVHYIHGSTGSANAAYSRTFSRKSTCDQEVSKIKKNQCLAVFSNAVNKDKRAVYDTLNAFVRMKNVSGTGTQTHIHQVLEVASRSFSGKTGQKYIYICSDMVHECTRRSLKKCPSDRAAAMQLAKQHAQALKSELALSERLEGATVYVLTPDDPMAPNPRNQYLKYYWQELFRQFGMTLDLNW